MRVDRSACQRSPTQADVPRFSASIWPPVHRASVELNLLLQRGELGLEDLHDLVDVVGIDELVALDVVEDLQDARCAGSGAVAQLGVERDPGEAFGGHRGPDLAFDERFDEHGEEVAEQQRFDAVRCLEVDRARLPAAL